MGTQSSWFYASYLNGEILPKLHAMNRIFKLVNNFCWHQRMWSIKVDHVITWTRKKGHQWEAPKLTFKIIMSSAYGQLHDYLVINIGGRHMRLICIKMIKSMPSTFLQLFVVALCIKITHKVLFSKNKGCLEKSSYQIDTISQNSVPGIDKWASFIGFPRNRWPTFKSVQKEWIKHKSHRVKQWWRWFSWQLLLWICPGGHRLESHIITALFRCREAGRHMRHEILWCKYNGIAQSLATDVVQVVQNLKDIITRLFSLVFFTCPCWWLLTVIFEHSKLENQMAMRRWKSIYGCTGHKALLTRTMADAFVTDGTCLWFLSEIRVLASQIPSIATYEWPHKRQT